MTPVEAINLIAAATEPVNVVKLGRIDYVHLQQALEALEPLVKQWQENQKEASNVVPIGNGK